MPLIPMDRRGRVGQQQGAARRAPGIRIRGEAIEETVARNTGGPLEMFDYLSKSVLDLRELSWVFHIIRNVRDHELTVSTSTTTWPPSVMPTRKAAKLGARSAAIVAYTGFSGSPSGIGLKALAHLDRLSWSYPGVVAANA